MTISIKTSEDIEAMRVAGRLAAEVLDYITPFVKPGVTTGELDRLCHEYMVDVQKTVPAPLNYAPSGYSPYPEVDLHLGQPPGLPRYSGRQGAEERRHRQPRHHRDQGRVPRRHQPHVRRRRGVDRRTTPVRGHLRVHVAGDRAGAAGRHARRHRPRHPEATPRGRASRWFASSAATASAGSSTKSRRSFTTASPAPGETLRAGMIFTIEPMINAGRREIRELADGWTIVTKDHSLSAQWEHTVLVTDSRVRDPDPSRRRRRLRRHSSRQRWPAPR